jgi:hypothetical protein
MWRPVAWQMSTYISEEYAVSIIRVENDSSTLKMQAP